ncbi:hypothetical protein SAP269_21540 (plasmid) [Spiroplasma ixodetis]|uniref:Uncharacterized protein n=1 Tax=Spiroplasma ixodetis TaxID=2141 RepID=A0ABN7BX95_9MOLU
MLNFEMQNYLGYEKNQHKIYSVNKFNQLSIIIFINFLVLIIIEVNIFLF